MIVLLAIQTLLYAATAIVVVVVLARRDTGEAVRLLVAQLERERELHRAEVAALCQRLQAPEMAVIEHAQRGPLEPPGQPLTDHEQAVAEDARLAQAEAERAIALMQADEDAFAEALTR